MKWEYLTYRFLNSPEIDTLAHRTGIFNDYGLQGWELVSVDNSIAYFKRPLRTKSEAEILAHFDYPQQERSSEV